MSMINLMPSLVEHEKFCSLGGKHLPASFLFSASTCFLYVDGFFVIYLIRVLFPSAFGWKANPEIIKKEFLKSRDQAPGL